MSRARPRAQALKQLAWSSYSTMIVKGVWDESKDHARGSAALYYRGVREKALLEPWAHGRLWKFPASKIAGELVQAS